MKQLKVHSSGSGRSSASTISTDYFDILGKKLYGQKNTYEPYDFYGNGNNGLIFRARDAGAQEVIIKIPKSLADPIIAYGFEKECLFLTTLSHSEFIAKGLDMGVFDQKPFLVLEFIEGDSVDKIMAMGNTIQIKDALEYTRHICMALSIAHAFGLVHRDVKPANIIIGFSNGRSIAKLLDFDLAKCIIDPHIKNRVYGTKGYIATEVLIGLEATVASDIFSLGAVLYSMSTGEVLLNRNIESQILDKHNVPIFVERIIKKAMADDPTQRYSCALEMEAEIRRQQKIYGIEI